MMGANMGYQPGPRQTISKKYAWLPVKTNSNRWVWFKEYYKIYTYYDENGKPPIRTLFWDLVLTKNEYLVWCIKNSNEKSVPFSGKTIMQYYAEC
jgi:hypothetical protein